MRLYTLYFRKTTKNYKTSLFYNCTDTGNEKRALPVVTAWLHGNRIGRGAMARDGDEVGPLAGVISLDAGGGVGNGLRHHFGWKQTSHTHKKKTVNS